MIENPLELNAGYRFGFDNMSSITKEMLDGHPIMVREDAGLLSQIVYNTKGNYIEIGSAYGGSVLIVLRTMDWLLREDKATCIDPFYDPTRMSTRRDLYKKVEPQFWRNIDHFGYRDRVEHIKALSHPFPEVLQNRRYSIAFIDGNHSYPYVVNDWNNLKDRVNHYIMFHDYIKPKVANAVDEAVEDENWELVAIHGWSAVLKRKN